MINDPRFAIHDIMEANAKLVIMQRAMKALVERAVRTDEDGYTCLYCNGSTIDHTEECVYRAALDLANAPIEAAPVLEELEQLRRDSKHADTCDNARLEGISARLDGKPVINNPYVDDDETSQAANEIWKLGWLEQDEEIRTNAILSALKRLKIARQQHPRESEQVKRVEAFVFQLLDDFEQHRKVNVYGNSE